VAPTKVGLRISSGAINGAAIRNSTTTNAANSTADAAAMPMVTGLPHPIALPRWTSTISSTSAPVSNPVPTQSSRALDRSRLSRRCRSPTAAAGTTSTTPNTNSARHPLTCTSSPPIRGPRAMAPDTQAPHTPMARARAAPVNSAAINASPLGNSAAAPSPCSTRPAISSAGDGASAQPSDPSPNTASPSRNARRRP
jgi:hypothetical protein